MENRNAAQAIMKAAEKLLKDRRFHEVTLDEVAREAGVGKGTIYRHFRDKNELFLQTALSGYEELCTMLRQSVPDQGAWEDRLTAACWEINRFFDERRQLFRLMMMEEGRLMWSGEDLWQRWLVKRKLLVEALGVLIEQGRGEGRVREDASSADLAAALIALLRMRARYIEASSDIQDVRFVLSLFLYGASGPVGGK